VTGFNTFTSSLLGICLSYWAEKYPLFEIDKFGILILKGAILILFIYVESAPIIFNAESTTVNLFIAQTFD